MANNLKRLDSYLVPGKHIHLIGIGGVSMRPLGLVLRGMGITVTGSDMNASVSTDCLLYTSPSPRDGLLSRMPSSA